MRPAPTAIEGKAPATQPVRVRPFAPADGPRWEAFVAACPEATIFHRVEWRAIMEEVFGHRTHYLLGERGDSVAGILPLAEVRSRLFGHALVSLPFCVYGGPASLDADTERALIEAAVECGRALGVEHLELRNRVVKRPDWPRQSMYVTFRKAIDPELEANMLAIPRKQRAMVRKGMKAELRSDLDPAVDRFFELYADNTHRHGTPPLSKAYFARLRADFGDACEVLTVVDPQGTAQSSVMSFYFRDEVLPYYAGDAVEARATAANDFKYWELMRRACERGLRTFDYGRSKRGTGSFDFKHNWGFEAMPLEYEYQLYKRDTVPQNNPLNPKYRMFIALWKRLPRGVVDRIGPYIVRNLG